jgi:outer membrane protein assembly factor BamB
MTEVWQARLPGALSAEPIIVGDVIWCAAGRSLVALDAEDGAQLTRRIAEAQTCDAIAAHGRIYWATTDGRIGSVSPDL